MSDAVSALSGAVASGFVRVEEAGLVGMITLRGDLSDKAFGKAVKDQTGVSLPETGQVNHKGDNALLWMSPDELLLTCPHGDAAGISDRLDAALSGHHALLANVSDARAMFHLTGEGPAIRDALAKLTPADLRATVFPVSVVRRTRLAQVPAAIWFTDEDTACVVCFRSVARYVYNLLVQASEPGSEVGFFR